MGLGVALVAEAADLDGRHLRPRDRLGAARRLQPDDRDPSGGQVPTQAGPQRGPVVDIEVADHVARHDGWVPPTSATRPNVAPWSRCWPAATGRSACMKSSPRRRASHRARLTATLSILAEAGVVRRIQGADDSGRFELADVVSGRHHHLICTSCGLMADVHATAKLEHSLAEAARTAADEAGFLVVEHRFDLVGLCAGCRP